MSIRLSGAPIALMSLLLASTALAQNVTLPNVDVTGQQVPQPATAGNHVDPTISSLPANIPAVIEERNAQELRDSVNDMTTAEMLKYVPSVEVRERAIGDTNGIIATRTSGTVSSAESILYADDQLLSNYLGNSYSYPPRWGLVSPVELTAVDMMYGPFSALYPGNSMGGVVTLSTRMPEKQEMHLETGLSDQQFNLYHTNQNFASAHVNAAYGDKVGKLAFWIIYDHLDAAGQPLNFANQVSSPDAPGNAVSTTPATGKYASLPVVSGAIFDQDSQGANRAIFGAYSVVHSVQDTAKIKFAADIDDTTTLTGSLALWDNDAFSHFQSYLTTANGQPFYNGNVNIGGYMYTVNSLSPSELVEDHVASDVRLKSNTGGVFDYDISSSFYQYVFDQNRAASTTNYLNPSAANPLAGTNTDMAGSGWQTFDARGIWRPQTSVLGQHEISIGVHYDRYVLNQNVWNNAEWQNGANTSLSSQSLGQTITQAVYIQDAWTLAPRWMLTLGGRGEIWQALGGYNLISSGSSEIYPKRSFSDFSPKASLAFQATPALDVRFSTGEGSRFPTVTELFQQLKNGSSQLINNPALKPEQVLSYDLTAEYAWAKNSVRVSLFDEDRHNALYSETATIGSTSTTATVNIDQVRIYGAEFAGETHDILVPGLTLEGGVTFSVAKILNDGQDPSYNGNVFPRIPDWRVRADAVYKPDDKWTLSAGLRYTGRQYSALNNADINPNVFGGLSSYLVTDIRASRKIGDGITLSAGIDNLNDCKYYVSPHPYPQTTGFMQLRWDL